MNTQTQTISHLLMLAHCIYIYIYIYIYLDVGTLPVSVLSVIFQKTFKMTGVQGDGCLSLAHWLRNMATAWWQHKSYMMADYRFSHETNLCIWYVYSVIMPCVVCQRPLPTMQQHSINNNFSNYNNRNYKQSRISKLCADTCTPSVPILNYVGNIFQILP
jgi:hypothetical protein